MSSLARWGSLTSGMFMELTAGTMYAFGVYSNDFKGTLNYTQSELESISTLGNVGLYTGAVAGFTFDAFGPLVTSLVGVLLTLGGYLLMWAGADKKLAHSPSMMGLYAAVWSHGSSWLDTTAIATNVLNFPFNTGSAVGLLKSFFGLSASIVTRFYVTWYKPDAIGFVFFLAIFVSGLGMLSGFGVRLVPWRRAGPVGVGGIHRFRTLYSLVLIIAAYLTFISVATNEGLFRDREWYTDLLIPLLVLPLIVLVPLKAWSDHPGAVFSQESTSSIPPKDSGMSSMAESEPLLNRRISANTPTLKRVGSVSFWRALVSVDLWLLFLVTCAWTGSGLMIINNLAQITESLGAKKDGQDVYVTVLSVSNCAGRLAAGYLSDHAQRYISRPLLFALFVGAMALSLFVASLSDLKLFFLPCVLVGGTYGAFWGLMPSIVAERFGPAYFGSLLGIVGLAPALGSFLVSKRLAGHVYDSHADSESHKCYGKVCYRLTYHIAAIACGSSCLLALFLWRRLHVFRQEREKRDSAPHPVFLSAKPGTEVAV